MNWALHFHIFMISLRVFNDFGVSGCNDLLGSFVATIGSTGSHKFMISLRVFNDFTRLPCCSLDHLVQAVSPARCRIPASQDFMISLRVFNDSGVGTGNALMVVHPQYGSRNVTKSLNFLRGIMKLCACTLRMMATMGIGVGSVSNSGVPGFHDSPKGF